VNLSEPFIRRPIATALVMASLAFVGITAYPLLPVAPLPQVDFPTIQVTATFQGASAEIMASSVAAPLERQFAQISGVTQLTSLSALGATAITIQFDLNRNIDSAGQDVQAAITAASKTLPQGMTALPSYKKVNPADSPVLLLSARSETIPLTAVDDYGDLFLAQQISQVPGVAQVTIFGDRVPSIRVQVDPAKLAATGLTLEEIRGMLVASTSNAAKGTVNTDRLSFTIAANDQITEPEQFEDVVLAYRNGAAIRVRDVGHAVPDAAGRNVAAYQNNKPGIILAVFKQPGANVVDTVDQIKAQLPLLRSRIPPLLRWKPSSIAPLPFVPRFATFNSRLRLRSRWWSWWYSCSCAASGQPSFRASPSPSRCLAPFGAMYLLKYSLDNISLMALTIAVGFVVDDAIVVVENIHRHMENGASALEAALQGSREIGFTVLSISVSLVSSAHGRHHRENVPRIRPHGHGLDRSLALVSLTLAPMLCSRFMHHAPSAHGRLYRLVESGFDAMLSVYRHTLDMALRHHAITLGVFFATLGVSC
jgi:multidrug efflux pump subunit AcrB